MYRELAPPHRLRPAVACLWWSSADGPKRIVPDGCLDLIVGHDQVFVAGPDTRAWISTLAGESTLHGIRFRPGQAPRALGVAAEELRDRRVPLDELWCRRGGEVTERLLHRPSGLADVVSATLTGPQDHQVALLLDRLGAGVPRVRAALADLEVGQRQLRRRFTAAVGYGPATYLRVARLQRARAHATARPTGLAELAVVAGYADQAHLARDCRALTGLTPAEYFGAIAAG
ncbi:AraC family transcriptional regulator [Haloechinothrix alba]|nr:helix-turn-helix domain-containing protein [Haloechinothrix alba]